MYVCMYVCMYLCILSTSRENYKHRIHNTFFKKPFLHLGFTLGLNQQTPRLWAFDTLTL